MLLIAIDSYYCSCGKLLLDRCYMYSFNNNYLCRVNNILSPALLPFIIVGTCTKFARDIVVILKEIKINTADNHESIF